MCLCRCVYINPESVIKAIFNEKLFLPYYLQGKQAPNRTTYGVSVSIAQYKSTNILNTAKCLMQRHHGCLPFTHITPVKILNAGTQSISKTPEHTKVK